jgi:hypothetical protein
MKLSEIKFEESREKEKKIKHSYIGKIRVMFHITDRKASYSRSRMEVLDTDIFFDGFISDVEVEICNTDHIDRVLFEQFGYTKNVYKVEDDRDYILGSFAEFGKEDMLSEMIDNELSEYPEDAFIEILGDLHQEWNSCVDWETGHDEGNHVFWVENLQHRQMTENQMRVLVCLEDDEDNRLEIREKKEPVKIIGNGRLRKVE